MDTNDSPKNPVCPGNTVAEYALIGTLVLLVCLGVFIGMGGNLNQMLADLKGDMRSQTVQAAGTENIVAVINNSEPNANGTSLQDETQATMAALMRELTPAERVLLQQDLTRKLQTAGANGTTELLSRQVAQLAIQLKAEGKITSEEGGLLMELANQGHRIAEVQRLVEDAVRISGGDSKKLRDMRFQFEGESYTPQGLAASIGFNGQGPEHFTTANLLANMGTSQPEIGKMLNLYIEVEKKGLLTNNPQVEQIVQNAVTQIAQVGNSVETVLSKTLSTGQSLADIDDFQNQVISNTTDRQSGNICHSGNYTDDGRVCR